MERHEDIKNICANNTDVTLLKEIKGQMKKSKKSNVYNVIQNRKSIDK